jgi:hypothetical protein
MGSWITWTVALDRRTPTRRKMTATTTPKVYRLDNEGGESCRRGNRIAGRRSKGDHEATSRRCHIETGSCTRLSCPSVYRVGTADCSRERRS